MIVGTAGHIDHGKTTLVRALTGVDTDRLKEEKARGISIQLGYAYVPLPDGDILGFIDVPGHEKLVHTMAAGASGIDFGLLVVAADDGVMPQTREHLAILQLLGVARGAVALTKADRADAAQRAHVRAELAALIAGSFLQAAPIFEIDARHADDPGLLALRGHLAEQAGGTGARNADGLFRLAVDRVFTLQGRGTVVTGTAHGGTVRVDDSADLRLMPAGTPVRVRSIHAQNRPSPCGAAGQRLALNLAGIDKDAIQRGDWIADVRCFAPARHIDVALHLLPDAEQPLRTWTPVHVHLGAAHHVAHAVPLSVDTLGRGERARVQLVFDAPVCAMPGERYILRNPQANRTIGGGMVLDPAAPDRKRRSAQRLAWLDAIECLLRGEGLAPVLREAAWGVPEDALARLTGRTAWPELDADSATWLTPRTAGPRTLIAQPHLEALCAAVCQALGAFHEQSPDEPGAQMQRLKRMALPQVSESLWSALMEHMTAGRQIARNGPWLHLPGHGATLSPLDNERAAALLARIHAGGFEPPWTRELAREFAIPEDETRLLLRKLVRRGELAQVVKDLFYHREQLARLAALVVELCQREGTAHAAVFRDRAGLGRKRAIQILEFFDRVGLTRRLRDGHVLRGSPDLFEPAAPLQARGGTA
ncbi:selenocysteine-specific translation elongation factor [Verticiella sediminum]|uniref:Selenocysteine-specific elongation factor n=1 Tax=Verticiella sediminum TaxID=1247510 RepID=A0A556AXH6_9BURK|nr:selenocysteine-specific translation elongation factor [Verticiella sediminum]TSH97649.1 selenocysteine-specific translation elongation factor [Verticiella sediminum]